MASLRFLVVAATLFTSLNCAIFARSHQEEAPGERPDEYLEISIANWDIANSFPESGMSDPARDYLENKFRVRFRPAGITWGDANEKLNIWAASGQLPDIIGGIATVGSGRYYQWIEDNIIRSLPSDLSGHPLIQRNLSAPEVSVFNVDGAAYLLPRVTYEDPSWWAMDRGILVRRDWREKLGIDVPESAEEFIDMCIRFATDDPDGDGIDNTVGMAVASVGFLWSQSFPNYGFTDERWIEDVDGKYRLGNTTRNAFELFKFYRALYQRGGLDTDFAISSQDPSIDLFSSGRAGVLVRQISPKHLGKIAIAWSKLQPDRPIEDKIEILRPWREHGTSTEMFLEKSYWSESYIEASVDDEKLSRILDLYEYLYSDEGIAFCYFGFEGEDFIKTGNNINLLQHDVDGMPMNAGDLYPIMSGGFAYQAVWSDVVQYIDPSIPSLITDMAREERDFRLHNWTRPNLSWSVQAINVPEKQALGIDFGADWIMFILDDTGRSDDELYQRMKERWRANGYDAAVEAVTAVAMRMK